MYTVGIMKWNANEYSFNAIVDVRRRRHEIIYLNISQITWARNVKIYHHLAMDSLYMPTGSDITSYFQSAANRTKMSVFGHVRDAISQ